MHHYKRSVYQIKLKNKAMGQGEVGGGHQNKYHVDGIIHPDGKRGTKNLTFRKKLNVPVSRDDRQSWTSGTPVSWEDFNGKRLPDDHKLELSTKEIQTADGRYKVNMLASEEKGSLTFHPLVQCYNQIMADLLSAGLRGHLEDLDNPSTAMQLWMLLEKVYLQGAQQRIKDSMDEIRDVKAKLV